MLEVVETNLIKPHGIIAVPIKRKPCIFTPFDVLNAVSTVTGITISELVGKSHLGHISAARKLYYYMACEKTSATLRIIGNEVNRRHSTVLIYHKRIGEWLTIRKYYEELIPIINRIEEKLITL